MKQLWLGTCLVFSACAVHATIANPVCGNGVVESGEQCDDGAHNGAAGDACSATCTTVQAPVAFKTTATWALRAIDGTQLGCPSGIDTARLWSQKLDAGGNAVGAPVADMFACAAGTGTSAGLEPAKYQSWIELAAGTATYAQSLAKPLDLTAADAALDVAIIDDGGYFQLTWHLVARSSGTPVTCADAAASGVEIISTDVNNTSSFVTDMFACTNGVGISRPLAAGTYTLSIDALDGSNRAVGTAPALTNQVVLTRNRVTDLGAITVPIDTL